MKKINLNQMEVTQGGDCVTAVAIGAGIGAALGSLAGPFGVLAGAGLGGYAGYALGCK